MTDSMFTSCPPPGQIAAAMDDQIIDDLWNGISPMFEKATTELAGKMMPGQPVSPRVAATFMACAMTGFKSGANLASQAIDALATAGALQLPDTPGNYTLLRAVVCELGDRDGACPVCASPWRDHTDGQLLRCAGAEDRPQEATAAPQAADGEAPAPEARSRQARRVSAITVVQHPDPEAVIRAVQRDMAKRPIDRLVMALDEWHASVYAQAGALDPDDEKDWGDLAHGYLIGRGIEARHIDWNITAEMASEPDRYLHRRARLADAQKLGEPRHGGLVAGPVGDLLEMFEDEIVNHVFALRVHGADRCYVLAPGQGSVIVRNHDTDYVAALAMVDDPAGARAQQADLIALANDGEPLGGWL
jgi:hypothetical protein